MRMGNLVLKYKATTSFLKVLSKSLRPRVLFWFDKWALDTAHTFDFAEREISQGRGCDCSQQLSERNDLQN